MSSLRHWGARLLVLHHVFHPSQCSSVPSNDISISQYLNDVPLMDQILPYIRATDEYSEFCDAEIYNLTADADADYFGILNESYLDAVEQCEHLHLSHSDDDCFSDCIYYSNPALWLLLLLQDTPDSMHTLNRMLSFYSSSAIDFTPSIQWQHLGDHDSCILHHGTYSYSAAIAGGLTVNAHGCCIPSSCGSDEDALKMLSLNELCHGQFQSYYGPLTVEVVEPLPREFDVGSMLVMAILVLFLTSVIMASVIKQFCSEYKGYDLERNLMISAFNIQDSWSRLTTPRKERESAYNFLDGVRVWSLFWVIYGHCTLYDALSDRQNLAAFSMETTEREDLGFALNYWYSEYGQFVFLGADSLFWLSGLFTAWWVHRLHEECSGLLMAKYLWIPFVYLQRLCRLWPMMCFMLFVQWQLSDHFSSGHYVTSRDRLSTHCDANWWRILSFSDNLSVDSSGGCMADLWFIQCDVQMFAALPMIVALFKRRKLYGFVAAMLPIACCLALRGYFASRFDFESEPMVEGLYRSSFIKPWTRMSPYFVGVLTMLLFLKKEEGSGNTTGSTTGSLLVKSAKIGKYMYFSSLFSGLSVIVCLLSFPRGNAMGDAVYFTISRPLWGCALSLIAFSLRFMGGYQVSVIKAFLSRDLYQSLSQLTYCGYLVQSVLFYWWIFDQNGLYLTVGGGCTVVTAIGIYGVTMAIALVLWLVMERPIRNVTDCMMQYMVTHCCSGKRRQSDHEMVHHHHITKLRPERVISATSRHSLDVVGDVRGGFAPSPSMDGQREKSDTEMDSESSI